MAQSGFAARLSRHLGRPVEAACAVRLPGTTMIDALCAGAGAGIGGLLSALVGGRRGMGAVPPVAEELKRRIGPGSAAR